MLSLRSAFAVIYLLHFPTLIQAASYLCSSQNTGSSFDAVYSMYQSYGACEQTCAGYAFEILQGYQCWCSNYFPAADVSTSECNTSCPGYDTDNCGGTLNGVYAYYQLGQASGTLSSSTASSTTSSSISSTSSTTSTRPSSTTTSAPTVAAPVTVVVTQTATPSLLPISTTSASSSGTGTGQVTVFVSSVSSTSHASSTTKAVTASTPRSAGATTSAATSSTSFVTDGNQQLSTQSKSGFFDSPGKVAGTFVVVGLVVLALIAGLVFFLLRRRRRTRSESAMAVEKLNRKESSTSTLEDQSALTDGRSRSGSASGLMAYPVREKQGRGSPNGLNWPSDTSEIVPIDQRLNPQPMLMRFDSNYSRHSLRDDEDYSRRVLTVANPEAD